MSHRPGVLWACVRASWCFGSPPGPTYPKTPRDQASEFAKGLRALLESLDPSDQITLWLEPVEREVLQRDAEGLGLSVARDYEIDTFEPTQGIALEVEAGRATMGNAIYRDLIQASLMVDARFPVLAVPVEYRYKSGARTAREPSYGKTYSVVEAIYGSPRLALPFEGLLLVGY